MIYKLISTSQVLAHIGNPDIAIVDIRPCQAFNGWKLQDEARGGHIPGAISFPLAWISHFSSSQLEALLSAKGITSHRKIIIYGYQEDACTKAAQFLADFGIGELYIYPAGLQAWAADSNLPLEHLENYQKLVYPQWVYQLISGQQPEHAPGQSYAIYEVSWQKKDEYQSAHLPGAFHWDLSEVEDPQDWNIRPDGELFSFLAELGIKPSSTCLIYSRDIMAAARAAFILMYAGVTDVRVLDGGLDTWINGGYPVETGSNIPLPTKSSGPNKPGHPEYLADIQVVKKYLATQEGLIVSVRSWAEYSGKTSGYDFIHAKGHISGAVWGYSGTGPNHMQDYRNPDNTMRAYPEIASNWQKVAITRDKKIIFYCGTGWRASEAFFYAYLMGWRDIAIYDGGWYEWSLDETNPISKGED